MKSFLTCLLFLSIISCNNSNQDSEPLKTAQPQSNNKNMKTLGLIGGTSWHSTLEYYSYINQSVNDYFGNNTNPPLLVYTLNQAEVHRFQIENKWDSIAHMLTSAAISLNKAGAERVMFCANTPHKVFDDVQKNLDFPIIHIADATANAIKKEGIHKVCFIGTKYTMEEDFIKTRLVKNGIEVIMPEEKSVINELHRIIQEELTYGEIKPDSKVYVTNVINSMMDKGAKGVVLGCTEFPLMFVDGELGFPSFNTTEIHSKAAVDFILNR